MEKAANYNDSWVFKLSVLLAAGLVAVLLGGLYIPLLYARETPNWRLQTLGQDLFDALVVVPLLIVSAASEYRRKFHLSRRLAAGVFAYTLYTFFIYCFSIHENVLFLLYCACLGLSFFGVAILVDEGKASHPPHVALVLRRIVGIYFVLLAAAFSLLWLSDIIPAMRSGVVPASLTVSGLPVNPVYVLDLSIFLPLLFIIGVGLMRGSRVALAFVPSILVFLILMSLTITFLTLFLRSHQDQGSLPVAIVMGIPALANFLILLQFMKKTPALD